MFKLKIKLGNDAMRSPEHVAQALERIAEALRDPDVGDAGRLFDVNGNTVGEWSVDEWPESEES